MKLLSRRQLLFAAALLAVLLVVISCNSKDAADNPTKTGNPNDFSLIPSGGAEVGKLAPEFVGIVSWLNSQPLQIKDLRGKVVLVDFWTYTCVNCIRTLPYLEDWHSKYADKGLVIIGVHSPEFDFEKDVKNVEAAAKDLGVLYPMALNSEMSTWQNYDTTYWPRKYLIDKDGIVRFEHAGEGRYQSTETQIRRLLTQIGANVDGIPLVKDPDPGALAAAQAMTRELYAGSRGYFSGNIGNVEQYKPNERVSYALPGNLRDVIYMKGSWMATEKYMKHVGITQDYEDEIVLKYNARSVNVVINPIGKGPFPFDVRVTFDGKPVPDFYRGKDITVGVNDDTVLHVDSARLYKIVSSPEIGIHEIRLSAKSDAFAIFAFTFGVGEQD